MNISDSQRISTKLNELGYKSASEEEADLVIVNACSVRQHAVDRIWGGIKKWKKAGKTIMITGCVVKADQKKLKDRGVDFFNIDDLGRVFSKKEIIEDYFHIKPQLSGKMAYIPIMTGCNNFCTYCAVPYTRGREKSRPIKDILSEVKEALDNNFKEILLLGQNVNSYKYGFDKLLLKIDKIIGDFKFNFMSSNPYDMTEDIIGTFSKLTKWERVLHLAMQSGDDEILRKMNRKYDSKKFLELVLKLKKAMPDLIITTDIIVGFPGETKAQFNNTVEICKKIGFRKAYIGQYSPRPGTVSSKMIDNVSKIEKKRRWLVLEQSINKKIKN